MSSSYLLRGWARPCVSLYRSTRVLSPSLCTFRTSCALPSIKASSQPLVLSFNDSFLNRNVSSVLVIQSKRFYSSRRNPWPKDRDWKATLKTGVIVLLGTGALIASTSLALGLVIAGATGFGVYTLYQRLLRPFRSSFRSSDLFKNVSSNVDTLNDLFRRSRRHKSAVQDDLSSLVQGMPLIMRGFVKTVFSFVGKAMQSSMERAGELRRRTNEYLQANKRVRDQMGDEVSVDGIDQWSELTVNGVGCIEAVFPVNGTYSSARVTVKASVGQGDNLNLTELKYRNRQTGETIDLLRDSSVGGRKKTVIDAEFVDLDDENGRSRW